MKRNGTTIAIDVFIFGVAAWAHFAGASSFLGGWLLGCLATQVVTFVVVAVLEARGTL